MLVHRQTFTASGDGYPPRSFMLSAFSIENEHGRAAFHIEVFDLNAGRTADTTTTASQFVAEAFIARWLASARRDSSTGMVHRTPDLLRAEREAEFQRERSREAREREKRRSE